MKNKIIICVSFLSLLIVTLSAQAQDSTKVSTPDQKMNSGHFSLNNVSLSVGYYNPSMNYFNNTFLPAAQTNDRFGGNVIYGGNISFGLPLNLGVRLSAWYWNNKVSGQNGGAFNSLNVSLTGITLGAFYTLPRSVLGFKPYIGIDGGTLYIQDKYDANETVIKKSGNDMIWTPFVGLSHGLGNKIIVGLEYGYVLGHYTQDVTTSSSLVNAKVPIEGHKIQVSIGYKFP